MRYTVLTYDIDSGTFTPQDGLTPFKNLTRPQCRKALQKLDRMGYACRDDLEPDAWGDVCGDPSVLIVSHDNDTPPLFPETK